MSTKNIKYVDRDSYLEKSESMLLSLSDAYFNKKRFLLGEGADKDKVIFYLQMNKSLCTKNCEMIEFIQDKIDGKLQDCGVKIKKLQTFSNYLEAIVEHLTSKFLSKEDVISECCGWEEASW